MANTSKIASKAVTAALIGLLSVVGLVAQTAQTTQKTTAASKSKATTKPAAVESPEQAMAGLIVRAKYNDKIRGCQDLWDKAKSNASTDLAEARAFADAKVLTPEAQVIVSRLNDRLSDLKPALDALESIKSFAGRFCMVQPPEHYLRSED
jgi:hypothetical protein